MLGLHAVEGHLIGLGIVAADPGHSVVLATVSVSRGERLTLLKAAEISNYAATLIRCSKPRSATA